MSIKKLIFIFGILNVCSAYSILSMDIDTGESEDLTISFADGSTSIVIGPTIYNSFDVFSTAFERGVRDYRVKEDAHRTKLLIELVKALKQTTDPFNDATVTQLLAPIAADELRDYINLADDLGAPALQKFLFDLLQRRRDVEKRIQQQQERAASYTAAERMQKVTRQPVYSGPAVTIMVDSAEFTLEPAMINAITYLKDMLETLSVTSKAIPLNASEFGGAPTFQLLLSIIKYCVIDAPQDKNQELDKRMTNISLIQQCQLINMASFLTVTKLLPLLFDWLAHFMLQETISSDDFDYIIAHVSQDILAEIKKRFFEPLQKQIKFNRIYRSTPKKTLDLQSEPFLSHNGQYACFSNQKQIDLFDIINKKPVATLDNSSQTLECSAISDDGSLVILENALTESSVWNTITNELGKLPVKASPNSSYLIFVSPNNKKIFYVSGNNKFAILQGVGFEETTAVFESVPSTWRPMTTAWSSDSRYVALSCYDKNGDKSTISIYDTQEKQTTHITYPHMVMYLCSYSADNFLAIDRRGWLYIIPSAPGNERKTTKLSEAHITDIVNINFSHVNKLTLVLGEHNSFIIDTLTGNTIKSLDAYSSGSFMPHDDGLVVIEEEEENESYTLQTYSFAFTQEDTVLLEYFKELQLYQLRKLIITMHRINENKMRTDTMKVVQIIPALSKLAPQYTPLLNTFFRTIQQIYDLNHQDDSNDSEEESSEHGTPNTSSEPESESEESQDILDTIPMEVDMGSEKPFFPELEKFFPKKE